MFRNLAWPLKRTRSNPNVIAVGERHLLYPFEGFLVISNMCSAKVVKALCGREQEFSTICGWIEKAMNSGQPLSVYISGSPGTGMLS